jgi:hypothetical protein
VATRETALVKACLTLLRLRGVMAWRQNVGAAKLDRRFVRFGAPGVSDILGVLKGGRFLAVECKAGKSRPTDAQAAFLAGVEAAGGVAVVVRDVRELQAILDEL